MARFKLPLFAVLAAAVVLAAFMRLGGHLAKLSNQQMDERLAWGQLLFDTSARAAQSYRTAALAKAAADPGLVETATAMKDAAPAATAADPVRKAVGSAFEALPQQIRRAAFFLVGNDKGVAVVPAESGAADVKAEADAMRLASAGAAGPKGTYVAADGMVYAVAAAPIRILGATGEQSVGWLGAAFPLDDAFAKEQAGDLKMPLAVVASGVVSASVQGPARDALAKAKDGVAAPVSDDKLPKKAPMLAGEVFPAMVKSFPLEGAEGARVVLISELGLAGNLADLTMMALALFLGILLAGLAVHFVAPAQAAAVAAPASQPQIPAPPVPQQLDAPERAAEAAAEASFGEAAQPPPAQEPAFEAPPPLPAAPEPAPAFEAPQPAPADPAFAEPAFTAPPPEPPPAAPEPAPEPAFEAAAAPAPEAAPMESEPPPAAPFPHAAPVAPPTPEEDFSSLGAELGGVPAQPPAIAHKYHEPPAPSEPQADTLTFGAPPLPGSQPEPEPEPAPAPPAPIYEPPAPAPELPQMVEKPFDPFAAAAAAPVGNVDSGVAPESTVSATVPEDLLRQAAFSPYDEPPPESTIVSQVPEELLRAARAHLARTAPAVEYSPTPAPSAEELHFHEVFDQFVATRAQCNEPADNLTYEKFSLKLRKNRDQLIQKYSCKSVRFQVYVKDGKAALKATPVRE